MKTRVFFFRTEGNYSVYLGMFLFFEYIFLGSRLGDSLLVHFEEEDQDSNEKKRESSSPIE